MLTQLKLKVFVSSTINDLPSERAAAEKAIKSIPAIPNMSELTFLASNLNSVDKCTEEVKNSDIYILILGGRYGFTLNDGKSITELEWATATQNKIPTLVFNLSYCKKEPKQEEFAAKVGDIYSGKFWCSVNNALELEEKIRLSLRNTIENYRLQRESLTEKIHTNLLQIKFPEYLYIANLAIDRNETIEQSRALGQKLNWKTPQRDVIWAALKLQKLNFSSDWVSYNNQIITFHNLSDRSLPISTLIDPGTVDHLSTDEFLSLGEDCERVFKDLLRNCFKQKVFRSGIQWHNAERLFIFTPMQDEEDEIKSNKLYRKWQDKKEATRCVFERVMKNNKPGEILKCKHLAFGIKFHEIERSWYISVMPDWFISIDGYKKSPYGDSDLSYIKRKERNQRVYNHMRFISYILRYIDEDNLFDKPYPFLSICDPIILNAYPTLIDSAWLHRENMAEQSTLIDEEILFDEL